MHITLLPSIQHLVQPFHWSSTPCATTLQPHHHFNTHTHTILHTLQHPTKVPHFIPSNKHPFSTSHPCAQPTQALLHHNQPPNLPHFTSNTICTHKTHQSTPFPYIQATSVTSHLKQPCALPPTKGLSLNLHPNYTNWTPSLPNYTFPILIWVSPKCQAI